MVEIRSPRKELQHTKKYIKDVSKAVADAYVSIGKAVYEGVAENISSEKDVNASKTAKNFPMVPSHKSKK